jgi:hypothetical protein
VYFHLLPYRQTEGTAQGHAKGKVPSIPGYTTISRRINRLDVKIEDNNKSEEFEDGHLSLQWAVPASRLPIEAGG